MADRRALPDADFFAGEPLLRMIATALVDLSRQSAPDDPVYTDNTQNAYNHLVLACLKRRAPPPDSVPGLARWAALKALPDWPIDLPADFGSADAYLVDEETRSPTQACLEWAVPSADAAAEQFENLLMSEAIEQCRAARSPASYTAFRELLITRPVLTGSDLALLAGEIDLAPVLEVIKRSYEAASSAYLRDGAFTGCTRCGCLLVPLRPGGFRCELDRCHRDGACKPGRVYGASENGGLYQLARPLRSFITGPGLAETDLQLRLQRELGLTAEMWPNYDAYDLRIALPDGRIWAIDVKDRVNPALLGRSARALRPDPGYDKAFLVAPQYRFDEREDYGRVFHAHLPDELQGSLELVSDTELLRRVRTIVRRVTRLPAQSKTLARKGRADA